MLINQANLNALFTGFKAEFNGGFNNAESYYGQIATTVNSNTSQETYAWLGQYPKLREWLGDRQLKNMAASGYVLTNKKYESSVAIPKDAIDDDQYGIYSPLFREMGYAARVHPDELIFGLLAAGASTQCYDGKNFFDTTHPVGGGTVANYDATGGGALWALLDTRRPLKPFIFQKRRDYALKQMNNADDEAVFMRDEYRFGIDARVNVGFGFWQQAYGSLNTLNTTNFDAAMAAMQAFKSDEGRPLGIRPNLLVCGPSNRAKAMQVLKTDTIPSAAGTASQTNYNQNAVDVLIVPWLT
mgnify:CR=1 FL=1